MINSAGLQTLCYSCFLLYSANKWRIACLAAVRLVLNIYYFCSVVIFCFFRLSSLSSQHTSLPY